jgi:hypothetical protein
VPHRRRRLARRPRVPAAAAPPLEVRTSIAASGYELAFGFGALWSVDDRRLVRTTMTAAVGQPNPTLMMLRSPLAHIRPALLDELDACSRASKALAEGTLNRNAA